jgi:hypothetical protein
MAEEAQRAQQAPEEQVAPTARLAAEAKNLATALAERSLSTVTHKVDEMVGRLTDYAEHGGASLAGASGGKKLGALALKLGEKLPGVGGMLEGLTEGDGRHPVRSALMTYAKEKVKGFFGGGGKGKGRKGKKQKVVNIVESIDIGAPRRIVYDQWTRFEDFPSFMKKVETVEQKSDEKLSWKAQVFWSHRTWESTILEQIPDQRIIWRSQGPKGYVDGAVTFHELGPDLTRVLLVLEYHPQGLFERTGNIWRAQGRRVRLELKHFRRHVMTNVLLHPDDLQGWRGEIRDSKVVKDQETALREERERAGTAAGPAAGEAGEEAQAETGEPAAEEGREEIEEPAAEDGREEEALEEGAEEAEEAEEEEEPEYATASAAPGRRARAAGRPATPRARGAEPPPYEAAEEERPVRRRRPQAH